MRRLRILLVDDSADIRVVLAELLGDLGHDVCAIAATEIEAVAAAERHAPDLMIVDAQLQSGNGVSAIEMILRRSVMPHIFMTGSSRQFPADAVVLRKPFGRASLMVALEAGASQVAAPAEEATNVQQ